MATSVVQWTTGNVGRRALRAILRHPALDLVGVFAHSPEKVGVDAADLCGHTPATGVLATTDVDALLALKPDACSYNPLWPDVDLLCRAVGVRRQRVLDRGVHHRGILESGTTWRASVPQPNAVARRCSERASTLAS